MKLACADNTFRLLEPWESAVELIRLLDLDGVDVCLMGNRSHIRPEDVRGDVPAAAQRIREGVLGRGLEVSDVFVIPWTEFLTMAPNHRDPAETSRRSGSKARIAGSTVRSMASTYSPSPEPARSGTFTVVSFPSPGPPDPG